MKEKVVKRLSDLGEKEQIFLRRTVSEEFEKKGKLENVEKICKIPQNEDFHTLFGNYVVVYNDGYVEDFTVPNFDALLSVLQSRWMCKVIF